MIIILKRYLSKVKSVARESSTMKYVYLNPYVQQVQQSKYHSTSIGSKITQFLTTDGI